jgi:hypothetical protein
MLQENLYLPVEELRRRIEALLDCTVCLIVLNTWQIYKREEPDEESGTREGAR